MMPLFTLLAGPVLWAKGIPAALWYAHNHRAAILPAALAFAERALASTRTAFPIETDKLRVVGQGIDTDRFRPSPEGRVPGRLRLLSVGRLSSVKNNDLMLRAFARLRAARPALDCRLTVIGEAMSDRDREYLARCRALASELGVAEAVEWAPALPFTEVHTAYRHGDVFLSANDNGLDKAILEAMASGLAVVAMHPAVAAPLGRFYSRDESGFSEALMALADLDEAERQELGARLRRHVQDEHSLTQLGQRIASELKMIAR